MMKNRSGQVSLLRFLPSVDALLKTELAEKSISQFGIKVTTNLARETIEELREELKRSRNLANEFSLSLEEVRQKAESKFSEKINGENKRDFKRVINATGVLIHTNLGRAPLAPAAQRAILEEAARYCTLEYDLETGERGPRGSAVEDALKQLTGAPAALVVNNCAAAAFLVLSALASGGETIVSRGELVEIGGDFRVPDIMAQSGTKLIEVGTTNRTRLNDFADAVTDNTRLLMRVHPSNFRIVGFTAMPELSDLAALARNRNLLLYEDAGSGALVDLSRYNLDEPVIAQSIKAGADVVTFSGDKLLGGCQAGLIVGRAEVIEKLRRHPLYRALRVDKIAYAALAATLKIYQRESHFADIPVLQMLAQTKDEIWQRAKDFLAALPQNNFVNLEFELIDGESVIGGGSAPLTRLPTILISIKSKQSSAAQLDYRLRSANPPVVGRVSDDLLLLDLRTANATETNEIAASLRKIERGDKDNKEPAATKKLTFS